MPVHLIAVEKKEPFRCGVWLVAPDTLTVAQRDNEAAIDRLRACLAEERWPTGYEERVCSTSSDARRRAGGMACHRCEARIGATV